MLDVGDGQLIYWEGCGHRDGKPAVVVHGGPGTGCSPAHDACSIRRLTSRAVRSARCRQEPSASERSGTNLSMNTPDHLVADIERLRRHLGIKRWLVYGASWGSALALAYAERHPERVTEMVIAAVTMTRRSEIQWLYHGVGRFFPAEWARSGTVCPPATVMATSWRPTPGCSPTPAPVSGNRLRGIDQPLRRSVGDSLTVPALPDA